MKKWIFLWIFTRARNEDKFHFRIIELQLRPPLKTFFSGTILIELSLQ